MNRKSFVNRQNITIVTLLLLFLVVSCVVTIETDDNELRPPIETEDISQQQQDSKEGNGGPRSGRNTRKSREGLEDKNGSPEDDELLESDEYSFRTSSAIKIVKAPDLSKDIDNDLSEILKEEAKKQSHDLYDRLSNLLTDEDELGSEKILTPEEMEAEKLYQSAMVILNKTRGDKEIGHSVLADAARRGHPLARAKIAWAQLLGHHPIQLNVEAAKLVFTELAEKGLPDAHMGLGFMFAAGIGQNVSQAKALLHYTFAALGDNTWAQMALGYRYWGGIGVPSNCEQALEFYQRVATKVAAEVTFSGGTALHRIRLLDEIENSGSSSGILDNDLIDYYQLLADKGDVQAQVGLGQLHYQGGRGVPLDHQKALHYFQQAANAGNAIAMAFLGKMYLEGSEHVKADNDTAFKFFKKAADLGNPVGQSGLGVMYLQGKGVTKDTVKAFSFFTKAAEQGWVDGQLQLGNMYFSKQTFSMKIQSMILIKFISFQLVLVSNVILNKPINILVLHHKQDMYWHFTI